jgi:putative ABC transport system ATP-binding protein
MVLPVGETARPVQVTQREETVTATLTTMAGTGIAARARDVWKVYGSGEARVTALRGVNVELRRAQFTAIMGPSGSGKSTLMHCLAGLDKVTRGDVFIGDTNLSTLSDKGLTRLRREQVGFIFQQFNLLPTLTAAENIALPLSIAGRKPDPRWYQTVIETLDLGARLKHKPSQLSGGQQQRVACARALVSRPEVVFADEPTGNLDSRSGTEVLTFLRRSVREFQQTVVMVTHDPNAASYADRVIFLADGAIVYELAQPSADVVLDTMKRLDVLVDGPAGDLGQPGGFGPGANHGQAGGFGPGANHGQAGGFGPGTGFGRGGDL